jgi:hypothetical protein
MALGKCIYCGVAGEMSREDYFPRALGHFEGMVPLTDRVCQTCNNEIGLAEGQLLAGPLWLPRWLNGMEGRHGRPSSLLEKGAAGVARVKLVVTPRGSDQPFEAKIGFGSNDLELQDTLRFLNPGESQPIPLNLKPFLSNQPSAERFRQILAQRGAEVGAEVSFDVRPENESAALALLQCLDTSGVTFENWTLEPQAIRVGFPVEGDERTLRAVGKVGFHGMLAMLPDLLGSEAGFSLIRTFIRSGGDGFECVRAIANPQFHGLAPGERPTRPTHIIHVQRRDSGVVARVGFFWWATSPGLFFDVTLASTRMGGVDPGWVTQLFVVDNARAKNGPRGRMKSSSGTFPTGAAIGGIEGPKGRESLLLTTQET